MSTQYLRCADTAKMVRAALKAEFPGVKFSVRSSTYSGGASITAYWTDGPTEGQVRALTDLYRGATFDGMTDMKSYHSTLLASPDGGVAEVHFGADFIFGSRTVSPEFLARCVELIPETPNGLDTHRGQCQGCGNWPTTTDDRWYADTGDHHGGMCCTRECAGRYLARRKDSGTMKTADVV